MHFARFAAALFFAVISFQAPALAGDKDKKDEPSLAKTPEECHEQFKEALIAKDAAALWAVFSKKTQKWLAVTAEEDRTKDAEAVAKSIGVTAKELEKLEAKDVAIRRILAQVDDAAKERIEAEKLQDLSVKEKMATAVRKSGDDERLVIFVKEGDGWYVAIGGGECDGGMDEEKK
ncbi:MAG: hypothetical protein K8T20_15895 [Planctomycetes bacterium]|nr:hypothetical protein [Planctomycetota bacterium]